MGLSLSVLMIMSRKTSKKYVMKSLVLLTSLHVCSGKKPERTMLASFQVDMNICLFLLNPRLISLTRIYILERINPEQQKSMLSILSSNASMELTLQKCRMDCKRFTIVCLKSTPPKSYLDIIKLMKMAYGAMIICLGLEERGHLMM